MAGDWRRLCNEDLHNLYASLHIISDQIKNELGGARNTQKDEMFIQNFHWKT